MRAHSPLRIQNAHNLNFWNQLRVRSWNMTPRVTSSVAQTESPLPKRPGSWLQTAFVDFAYLGTLYKWSQRFHIVFGVFDSGLALTITLVPVTAPWFFFNCPPNFNIHSRVVCTAVCSLLVCSILLYFRNIPSFTYLLCWWAFT